ncbi:hypothetical protein [Paenibacillus hexagrammi]|uniref:Uncharacterized protein n=1 Tax=Paenibacillus hexagrammi TaxID=2908839 RepID=A0ABY3SR61_9BACL|nr:hypothetical protein [Paenibacillus sp. YPD9-1]UJF35457.1 hypothetical protein L0M14_10340 [Paenibacillus sp. YPD9-1]
MLHLFGNRHKLSPAHVLEVQLQTLESLGFSFQMETEVLVQSLLYQYSRMYYEDEPYDFLLSICGDSHLDENYHEIRFTHDVWTLDLHSTGDARAYLIAIDAMNRLAKGDFLIEACKLYVDPETNEAHVSYQYHGLTMNCDISIRKGWMDVSLFRKLGKLANKGSSAKQFYYRRYEDQAGFLYSDPDTVKKLNGRLKHKYKLLS